MRTRSLALPLVLVSIWLGAAPPRAAGAALPDTALVRLLAKLRSASDAGRWRADDSLATLVVSRAGRTSPPDSGALATGLFERGRSSYDRALYSDSLANASLARALTIERRLARPDSLLWASTGDVLGRMLTERGLADSAVTVLMGVVGPCHGTFAGGDSMLADLWVTIGRAHYRAEHDAAAIAAFDTALALRERRNGPDSPRVANALDELAVVYSRGNDLEDAEPLLERAIAILERPAAHDTADLAGALSTLATVQYKSGDIGRSIETLERSVELRVKVSGPNTPYVIPPLYNIGIRLFDFGDAAGANAIFTQLVPRAEASFGVGNGRTELIRYMAGVSAIQMGDTAAAARFLNIARAQLQSHPLDQNHAANLIEVYYAKLLERRGDHLGARRAVDAGLARERATTSPDLDAMVQLLDTQASAEMADRDTAALDSTRRELAARFGRGVAEPAVYLTQYLHVATRCERWRGLDEQAWRDAADGEAGEREQLRTSVRALPDERALELEGQLGESLDALVALSAHGGEDRVATAWDRIVRRRGLVSAELARRRAPLAAPGDTALSGAHARWVAALRRLARLEVAESNGGDAGPLARARAALERAETEYGMVAGPRGDARDTAEADLARVRAALGPDDALVSIVESAARTDTARFVAFATLGSAGALRRVELGPARPLAERIDAWRAALARPPIAGRESAEESACRALGADVRRRTWDRVAALVPGARSVTVVADGALAELPWQALPTGKGSYLVESGPLVRTPGSERELLAAPGAGGAGMLAVGDPDYESVRPAGTAPDAGGMPLATVATAGEGSTALPTASAAASSPLATLDALRGRAGQCSDTTAIALPALPGAREEAVEIARAWDATHAGAPARVLLGADATERAFEAEAPGREVLHIATHGVVWGDRCAPVYASLRGVGGIGPVAATASGRARATKAAPASGGGPAPPNGRPPRSPWDGRRVWLAFAGANHARAGGADPGDGLLTADDVVTLDLSGVDWVVLSACQSGIGQDWPLEGSVGMRRAFRLAGAHTVIASQWSVSDRETREWMRALYAARASGERSAAGAMRAASRAMIASRRRAHEDTLPFRWAAFTATGL